MTKLQKEGLLKEIRDLHRYIYDTAVVAATDKPLSRDKTVMSFIEIQRRVYSIFDKLREIPV